MAPSKTVSTAELVGSESMIKSSKIHSSSATSRDNLLHQVGSKSPSEIDTLFNDILQRCRSTAKGTEMSEEVATAKMLCHCIRMLHSEGWFPRTVVRAMVKCEENQLRSVKRNMYEALRERRDQSNTNNSFLGQTEPKNLISVDEGSDGQTSEKKRRNAIISTTGKNLFVVLDGQDHEPEDTVE